jgi:HlyD family secretion protein
MQKKLLAVVAITAVTGLSAHALYSRRGGDAPELVAGVVSRGPIVSRVAASGTLEAVTTVQVGSQISGTVQALYADFNSIVKRGQVLARLDPSLLQADLEQAKATLTRSEAEVERLAVALADAKSKEDRARELAGRELIPRTDLETAEVARQSADAQLKAARAQVSQAKAALGQAQVNLAKTVITSPIDGIVTARQVDVGQTVAASLQAPTLFIIAADLGQMQVKASVDESDLGVVREGQPVTFSVDAYPQDAFHGVVKQVRLNPVVDQNVVTYAAIISAPNPELKLRPGMTASVTVEVSRRESVLRVPNAALRFEPGDDLLASMGQETSLVTNRPAATKNSRAGANQPARSNVSKVWIFDGGLHRVPVVPGASDGTLTEVRLPPDAPSDEVLDEGSRVAIGVASSGGNSAQRPSSGSSSPLLGSPPRRF